MSTTEEELDPYELLDLRSEANDQEIKTAYRQLLKVHPDRAIPMQACLVDKLIEHKYELLLDPLRRLALDAKLRVKLARKERFKAYDSKRKNLVEDLEERERAFQKARVEKQQEEIKVWHETERRGEETDREERERELRHQQPSATTSKDEDATIDEMEAPSLAIAAERDRGSELPREKVFVKISWQPKSRRSESELLQHISNKIAEKKEEYEWILEHLPALKFEASFGDLVGIQSRLKAYPEFKDVYEERILRIYVFDVLHKLSSFRARPVFFIRRFAQIVRCHQWLHDVAGILHRDNSLNNLMYREKHGTIYGVLNDFDLASLVADLDKSLQSSQRTGTRIYMAFDLLSSPNPPRHLNRHDLESFFYVLLDVIHNPHGQSLNMGTWFALDDLSLGKGQRVLPLPCVTPPYPLVLRLFPFFRKFKICGTNDVVASNAITGASFLSPLDAFLLGRSDD
ncbi:hypothetical protein ONZ45_g7883 [Pleurotus djamor]|nr:hypothetical protein ONZ45_g7883 [Pleurotus djamor]